MELLNLSPYTVQSLLAMEDGRRETLLVIVKGIYALGGGKIRLADDQEAVCLADAYRGEPDRSSLRCACETPLHKPATDVILLGSAYAPVRSRGLADVTLSAGRLRKTLRVFGDRRWEGPAGAERIGAPEPFDRIPLVFERAFGGVDDSDPEAPESESRNPVGCGFRAKGSRRPVAGTLLPNLENFLQPVRSPADRPEPAGTSYVAPFWEPRRKRAGTYGADWQNGRAPFLPDDYDPLFQQTAPSDQIYPGYMEGGEPVLVENASPGGRLEFALPARAFDVAVRMGEDRHELPMVLDTVVIDGDAGTLGMVWRGRLPVHNRVYDVDWIRVAEREGA